MLAWCAFRTGSSHDAAVVECQTDAARREPLTSSLSRVLHLSGAAGGHVCEHEPPQAASDPAEFIA